MRRLMTFPCAGETLAATLDEAIGTTGLLIVSGGNEIRIGAHRSMAELAARIAQAGYPVFRYDRRGIGDSTGENNGFESTADDICEAAAAFRRECPHLTRIIAFGNCDAASALILFHPHARTDGLILTNPWTIEATDNLPPAAAIRSRYLEKLKSPRELLRLLTGGVNIGKIINGLLKLFAAPTPSPAGLPARLATALNATSVPVTFLLASDDNTAIAFADHWKGVQFAPARARMQCHSCNTGSHSFAGPQDMEWLSSRIIEALG